MREYAKRSRTPIDCDAMTTLLPHRALAALLILAAIPASAAPQGPPVEQTLREERVLVVQGSQESWRLVWQGKTRAACGLDDPESANTCPCAGWAYGETGKLSLVRNHDGREIDRMDLGPLFADADVPDLAEGAAVLQRWPTQLVDIGRAARRDASLVSQIKLRPTPTIMKFADYDRDGAGTEFLIQVATLPCGKLQFAALGVTAGNRHLHALSSVAHPGSPLVMPLHAWQALLANAGPTRVTVWPCGDHGSDRRSELEVSAKDGNIRVKERDYSCPAKGEKERLLEESDR
jgi:hypothetical protein